ncbi:YihY family inner membrane protein [Psychrobacter sp. I-STPA10]|uniref:YihY family inner membrane protein n=1 Tax=Psychrobacter sp. I-STPA10 TaxID=2585769 RepID=UPI001E641B33|nr:YihY family inner membrane protein [Psychrobacter sp. I-STPA10]
MEKLLKKLPFYNQQWFVFLRFLIHHFLEDNCQQKAASLTYTTLLSIVPVLTILLIILSSVPALGDVRAQIYQVIYNNLLPQSSMQVSQYINEFTEKSTNLTAMGIMVLFVTTVMTLFTIETAFNQIWRVEDKSGGMKSIVRYWLLLTVGPLVLGTAFIVSSTVQSLSFLNQQIAGYGIDWSFWVHIVSFVVTTAGFIGMYWFIPKAYVPIKNAAIAGVIAAISFELLKYIFGIAMSNATNYEAIYGAFAALPIFLLWIYLSWNLILIGVEISYTLTIFETKEVYPRHPLFSLLDMLNLIYDRYQLGQPVDEQDLRDVLGRKELPKWYTYIHYLKKNDLITVTEHNRYVLKRDLSQMSLWDFYTTLPYPLPIKDELDLMDDSIQTPWLSLLAPRLINTENYARKTLDVPLADIFSHSHPRPKTEPPEANLPQDSNEYPAQPEAFDESANKTYDNQNREQILPETNEQPKKAEKNRFAIFNKLRLHKNTNTTLISEDDNPNKPNKTANK